MHQMRKWLRIKIFRNCFRCTKDQCFECKYDYVYSQIIPGSCYCNIKSGYKFNRTVCTKTEMTLNNDLVIYYLSSNDFNDKIKYENDKIQINAAINKRNNEHSPYYIYVDKNINSIENCYDKNQNNRLFIEFIMLTRNDQTKAFDFKDLNISPIINCPNGCNINIENSKYSA